MDLELAIVDDCLMYNWNSSQIKHLHSSNGSFPVCIRKNLLTRQKLEKDCSNWSHMWWLTSIDHMDTICMIAL